MSNINESIIQGGVLLDDIRGEKRADGNYDVEVDFISAPLPPKRQRRMRGKPPLTRHEKNVKAKRMRRARREAETRRRLREQEVKRLCEARGLSPFARMFDYLHEAPRLVRDALDSLAYCIESAKWGGR